MFGIFVSFVIVFGFRFWFVWFGILYIMIGNFGVVLVIDWKCW